MPIVLIASLAALLATGAAGTSPPIQNPGAPGATSREITASESVAMSLSTHTQADVRFMQHMIVHHAQAVEMNALIEARTDNRRLRLLGQRIARSQAAEMALMRRWLSERGEPVADADLHRRHGQTIDPGHGAHTGHGEDAMAAQMSPSGDTALMAGMLTPDQMAALASARGPAFDRLFLEGMIHHHRGALDMVEALLSQTGNGEDPQLSEFLTHVTADQAAEILRMQTMLSAMTPPGGDEEEALRP